MGLILSLDNSIHSFNRAGFVGLLDEYTGAAAGYSLRQLSSSYTGSAIRVRRSSDNSEQDIGFVNNELDTTGLLSFVGANNADSPNWYNQGNVISDAIQPNASQQPRIVSSGSLIQDNSKPAIQFDGVNDFLKTNSSSSITDNDSLICIVSTTIPANFIGGLFQEKQISTSFNRNEIWGTTSTSNLRAALITPNASSDLALFYSAAQSATQCLITFQNVANTYSIYRNGVLVDSGFKADKFTNNTELFLGIMRNLEHDGYIQEFVLWNSDQSANRTGIETNIANYYGITL